MVTLNNVPGNASTITIEVDTRSSTNPGGGASGCGQSWVIAGLAKVDVQCACDFSISSQPSDKAICAGVSTSFTVGTQGGTSQALQWQYNNGSSWVNVSNGTPAGAVYSGATSGTLQVSGVSSQGSFQYRARASFSSCPVVTSNTATLTVSPPPSASISGSNSVCAGGTSTFTASGGGTYVWSTGATSASIVVSTPGIYTVTVTNNGCTATASRTLDVTPKPLVNIACEGDPATNRVVTSSSKTCASLVYGFYSGNLVSNYTSQQHWSVQSGNFREFANGTATMTMTVVNNANSNLVFNAVVVLSGRTFSPPAGSPKESTQCVGDINNSDWYYYTETKGNLIGANALAGAIVSFTRMGEAFQVGTGANLNAANVFGASGWLDMVVSKQPNSGPLLTVNPSHSDFNINLSGATLQNTPLPCLNICVGESTMLIANAASGTGSYMYAWSNGSAASSITVSPILTTTYTVTVTDANGCTATDQATVTVTPAPTVSINPSNSTVCVGGGAMLTATTSAGTGCVRQWQSAPSATGPWTNISGQTGATFSPSTNAVGTFYYRVTYSCTGTNCPASNSNVATLTVVPDPSVSISANTIDICVGGSATLTATPAGGLNCSAVQWQTRPGTSGTWVNTGTPGNTLATPTSLAAGTYQYRALYNCTGTGCDNATSNTVTLTVVAAPQISITPTSASICAGESPVLTATVSGGACTIQWQSASSSNGPWTNISGANATSYVPTLSTGSTLFYRAVYTCATGNCPAVNSNVTTLETVCAPPGPDPRCAPPTTFNHQSIADGNWSSPSTWLGGNVPPVEDINNRRIKISHNVYVPNNNIKLKQGSILYVVGGSLTLQNGNLEVLDSGNEKAIFENTTLRTSGNIQQNNNTVICITNSTVDVGEEQSGVNFVSDATSTSANFQNGGGFRRLENVCMNVTHDYQNVGEDVLINVCADIGDQGSINGAAGINGGFDGQDSGNFQNQSGPGVTMAIYNSEFYIANGDVQNSSLLTVCDVDFRLTNGNFQNQSNSTITGCDLVIWINHPSNGLIQNSGTWSPSVVDKWRIDSGANPQGINLGTRASQSSIAMEFDDCSCVSPPCIMFFLGQDVIVCAGATIPLNPTITNPGPTLAWSSTGSGTFLPNINTPQATYVPSAGDIVAGTVTLMLSSVQVGSCPPVIEHFVVTILPDPEIVVSPSTTSVCVGGTATLTANVSGGTGTCTIQWQSGTSASGPWTNISGANAQNYNVPTEMEGTYYFRATYTCTGASCDAAVSNVATIVVVPGQAVSITPPITSSCEGGTVILVATISGAIQGCTIQWRISSTGTGGWSDISGATSMTYQAMVPAGAVRFYRAVFSCGTGDCGSVISNIASVSCGDDDNFCILTGEEFDYCTSVGSVSGNVSTNDSFGSIFPAEYTLKSGPASGNLNFNNNGAFTYTNNIPGQYSFTYELCITKLKDEVPQVVCAKIRELTVIYEGPSGVSVTVTNNNSSALILRSITCRMVRCSPS